MRPDSPKSDSGESEGKVPTVRRAIPPAAFYKSVREQMRADRAGPSEEEIAAREMKRRLASLERWAAQVQEREITMLRRKMATALQMPKLSQSEDLFWMVCSVENVSYQTAEYGFAHPPTHPPMCACVTYRGDAVQDTVQALDVDSRQRNPNSDVVHMENADSRPPQEIGIVADHYEHQGQWLHQNVQGVEEAAGRGYNVPVPPGISGVDTTQGRHDKAGFDFELRRPEQGVHLTSCLPCMSCAPAPFRIVI